VLDRREIASAAAVSARARRLSGAAAIITIPSNDRRAKPWGATEVVAVFAYVSMTTNPLYF
jgi:hypothetical protein